MSDPSSSPAKLLTSEEVQAIQKLAAAYCLPNILGDGPPMLAVCCWNLLADRSLVLGKLREAKKTLETIASFDMENASEQWQCISDAQQALCSLSDLPDA